MVTTETSFLKNSKDIVADLTQIVVTNSLEIQL